MDASPEAIFEGTKATATRENLGFDDNVFEGLPRSVHLGEKDVLRFLRRTGDEAPRRGNAVMIHYFHGDVLVDVQVANCSDGG
mmetsp:Transcript_25594/g.54058  ORF Transcript_25594/g.54058 Transcript_25594/m.54058 type:complete len:83 (-) Transcript_25594:222-470(-)